MKILTETAPAWAGNFLQLNMSSKVERGGTTPWVGGQWLRAVMILALVAWCGAAAPRAAAQPVNDNFTNASVLLGPVGAVFGATTLATQEPNEPVHWNFLPRPGASQHSVWYRWTAPSTGFINFQTPNASYDSVLAAYTGTDLGSLILQAADDDSLGFNLLSSMTFFAFAGTEYFIAVDGFDYGSLNPGGTETGSFFLSWSSATGTNVLGPTGVQLAATNF